MTEARWYVAMCRTEFGRPSVALINLKRQSIEHYWPLITVERIRDRRISERQEPMFGPYLLVNVPPSPVLWRAINSTRGVVRMIGPKDGPPSPLPEGTVERLKEAEKQGKLRKSEWDELRRRDRVRVKFGEYYDLEGVVDWAERERVKVLLDLLGRKVMVSVPRHALALVAKHKPSRSAVATDHPKKFHVKQK